MLLLVEIITSFLFEGFAAEAMRQGVAIRRFSSALGLSYQATHLHERLLACEHELTLDS